MGHTDSRGCETLSAHQRNGLIEARGLCASWEHREVKVVSLEFGHTAMKNPSAPWRDERFRE